MKLCNVNKLLQIIFFLNGFGLNRVWNHLKPHQMVWCGFGFSFWKSEKTERFGFQFGKKCLKPNQTKLPQHYNEDIDDDPQSDSLPIADFIPEEDMENGPSSDSSGFWQWPENQLGLPQSNLDNKGEMKQLWNTKMLPRQGGLCDPSWSWRQSWKLERNGYELQYEAVAGKRKKGE